MLSTPRLGRIQEFLTGGGKKSEIVLAWIENIFCPSTLPYVSFSTLSEEEMAPIPFHQAWMANLLARFSFDKHVLNVFINIAVASSRLDLTEPRSGNYTC